MRLHVTSRSRGPGRLDTDGLEGEPSADAVVAAASPGAWLAGGEPTLRADLPRLLAEIPDAGLITDGLVLTPRILDDLRGRGLSQLRLVLHATRPDAHEWLTGVPGATLRTLRAIRLALRAAVPLEVEVALTRPTTPLLPETVSVLVGLGVRRLHLRRVTRQGAATDAFVTLSPRLALLEPVLAHARRIAARAGAGLVVEGVPACAAPGADLATPAWSSPTGSWRGFAAAGRCSRCTEACPGAPADYIDVFGWSELRSEGGTGLTGRTGTQTEGVAHLEVTPGRPPPRVGRAPATRVRDVVAKVAAGTLGGDPMPGPPRRSPAPTIRAIFPGPSRLPPDLADLGPETPQPTRRIKLALVQAAQEGAQTLRISSSGSLAHPQAAHLLRETLRLGFSRVEVAGEASALGEFTDAELRRLRGLASVDAALFGPDAASHDAVVGPGAFDATLTGLARLHELAGVPVGLYAVLTDPATLPGWARSWPVLPGPPRFRLGPGPGSLTALAEAAGTLDHQPTRRAIEACLPPCLVTTFGIPDVDGALAAWGDDPPEWLAPSKTDLRATFDPCPCPDTPGCRGLPTGWTL